jgi:hypothetical protein
MKHLTGYILITSHRYILPNAKNARARVLLQYLGIPTIRPMTGHSNLTTTNQ